VNMTVPELVSVYNTEEVGLIKELRDELNGHEEEFYEYLYRVKI
jgi:hypothetical protein